MSAHAYRAAPQPAHRYAITDISGGHWWLTNPKRRLIRCCECNKLRRAENLIVQAYYDAHYFWCRPGKGCACPSPKEDETP